MIEDIIQFQLPCLQHRQIRKTKWSSANQQISINKMKKTQFIINIWEKKVFLIQQILKSFLVLHTYIFENMHQEQFPAIVIDNGSGMCKAGFAEEEEPRTCFPSVLGYPKYERTMLNMNHKNSYIGEQALAMRGVLRLHHPVQHGIVNDWNDMTKIWHHCFYNELRVTPSQHPVLLTEAPRNPKANREKMTEIMFEHFEAPYFYLAIQAVLSLYSQGRYTGLVLDSGDGVTHAVPVFDTYGLSHAIERNNFAGRDLTAHMKELLASYAGINFQGGSGLQNVRKIKEDLCYVAADYEAELRNYAQNRQNSEYQLPDGQIIKIGSQRIRCPEALFKPMLAGRQLPGLHEMLYSSIMKCDIDLRRDLARNIILSGGTTMYPGMAERLQKELAALAPSTMRVRVRAYSERNFSVWIGGSIMASLSSFKHLWISKQEYQETGSSIVHRKCF